MERAEPDQSRIHDEDTNAEVVPDEQANGSLPSKQQSVCDYARLLPHLRAQRPPSQTVDTSPALSRLPRTRFGDRASRESY